MAEQSQFSRLPKKQLVLIAEKLLDEGFPQGNPYGDYDFNTYYEDLSRVGKYFNITATHEDVEFFAKFFEMNDDVLSQIFGGEVYEKVHAKFFETQGQWAILGRPDRVEFFKKIIVDLGIDYDKLLAESQDKKYDAQIAQDKKDASDLGIRATPSFIIGNHTRVTGGLPLSEMIKYIDVQ